MFHGKVAIVTGGATGIGGGTVLRLAEEGAKVLIADIEEGLATQRAEMVRKAGGTAEVFRADMTKHEEIRAMVAEAVKRFGRLDILVAAAGVTVKVSTLEMKDEDWRRILDTNLTGTLHACQAFGAAMIERGAGRIINVASLSSFLGFHEVAAYTASKSGVAGLTRALAVEWAPHGVTVNAIVPGVFRTDLNSHLLDSGRGQELLARTPMRRFGQLEELVGATIFLASDAAGFVTGQLLAVDGGFNQ